MLGVAGAAEVGTDDPGAGAVVGDAARAVTEAPVVTGAVVVDIEVVGEETAR